MALPIIAAGALARYGAKKLLKHLVKRKIKKPINKQNLKNKGTYLDKKKARKDINQLNKETSKLKKVNTNKSPLKHSEVEYRINLNRDYVSNTRSNYSSKARKTLPKSK